MEIVQRFNGRRGGGEVSDLSSECVLRLNESLRCKIIKASAVQFGKWSGMVR